MATTHRKVASNDGNKAKRGDRKKAAATKDTVKTERGKKTDKGKGKRTASAVKKVRVKEPVVKDRPAQPQRQEVARPEYSKENRFPFYSGNKSVSVCNDNHEDMYDMEFVFDKVLERFPQLDPEPFYAKIQGIQGKPAAKRPQLLKMASDDLLKSIKMCMADETFVHALHDRWGIGVDRLLGTLYAVYGYYFFTGKRTANIIKKILDGYKEKPAH